MRMGQKKGKQHTKNGKEDGEETPADLKGQLMGTAKGWGGREGGFIRTNRTMDRFVRCSLTWLDMAGSVGTFNILKGERNYTHDKY